MLGLLTSWNLPNSQFPELQIYKLEKENVCPNHCDKVVVESNGTLYVQMLSKTAIPQTCGTSYY